VLGSLTVVNIYLFTQITSHEEVKAHVLIINMLAALIDLIP